MLGLPSVLKYKFKPKTLYVALCSLYLFAYLALLLKGRFASFMSDECGYVQFSKNILHGFYSPTESAQINLWWGPGFPLFLVPFTALGAGKPFIVLANILIDLLGVFLLLRVGKIYVGHKGAIIVSFAWSLYFFRYQDTFTAASEPLATLLLIAVFYFYTLSQLNRSPLYLLPAGLLLGWLALTKVIFAYVIIAFLFLWILALLAKVKVRALTALAGVCLIAILATLPYQIYTYGLTSRVFYFGSSGGSSLYWASSPFASEYGDWNNDSFTTACVSKDTPCNSHLFAKNHKDFFDSIADLDPVDRDAAMRKQAVANIVAHPLKYASNVIQSFSRMFFNIPNSYFYQGPKTIFRILPNSILLTFWLLSLAQSLLKSKHYDPGLLAWMLFILIYLFGSMLLSVYPRMLHIALPAVFVWIINSYQIYLRRCMPAGKIGKFD